MRPDTISGIISDLGNFLNEGWTLIRDAERIRILPPQTAIGARSFDTILRDEVWRIARFITYADFVCIERTPDGNYRVFSKLTSGGTIEVLVQKDRS